MIEITGRQRRYVMAKLRSAGPGGLARSMFGIQKRAPVRNTPELTAILEEMIREGNAVERPEGSGWFVATDLPVVVERAILSPSTRRRGIPILGTAK